MELFFYFFVLIQFGLLTRAECQKKDWKLIWSDEFSAHGKIDPGKWSFSGSGKAD